MRTGYTTEHIKSVEFEVTTDYIGDAVAQEVVDLLLVLFTDPRDQSNLQTIKLKDGRVHVNGDLVHVVTVQFLESADLQSILEVDVVVPWNDIHSDAILTQLLEEVHAVGVECLVVYKPSMLERITQVDDVLDVIFEQVRKEHLGVEVILILDKDV